MRAFTAKLHHRSLGLILDIGHRIAAGEKL